MAPDRRAPLAILVLTVFLDLLGFGLILPILPYLAERYGASPLAVTALMASYSLMQVLFAPVWGGLSDRIGRRPVILVSLSVSSVGYLILGFGDSLLLVFAARILAGLGNANIAVAAAYVADVTPPDQRSRGMGLIGAAFGLGFVFGPALGGWLGGMDVAWPAFLAAGLTLLDLILAFFLLPEPERRHRGGARRLPTLGRLRQTATHPTIALLFLLFFATTFAFAQLESTFALFIEHRWHHVAPPAPDGSAAEIRAHAAALEAAHGAAARQTGLVLFVVGLVMVAVQGGLIGRLTTRFGEARLIRTGIGLQAVGLALVPLAPTVSVLIPVSALLALGSGLLSPSLQGYLSRMAEPATQGETLGLAQSLGSLARVGGPLLGGALFQWMGVSAPYWTASLLMLVTAGIALRLPLEPLSRPDRDRQPDAPAG